MKARTKDKVGQGHFMTNGNLKVYIYEKHLKYWFDNYQTCLMAAKKSVKRRFFNFKRKSMYEQICDQNL